jgi:hypothetical protein
MGITVINKNGKYDKINYWLQHISLTYCDASRQGNLYHCLFVYWYIKCCSSYCFLNRACHYYMHEKPTNAPIIHLIY